MTNQAKPEPLIHGDNVRFNEPAKTCDNITFRSENYHARYCRYHLSYKISKKGKPPKRFSLMITWKCKSLKYCYGGDMLKNMYPSYLFLSCKNWRYDDRKEYTSYDWNASSDKLVDSIFHYNLLFLINLTVSFNLVHITSWWDDLNIVWICIILPGRLRTLIQFL